MNCRGLLNEHSQKSRGKLPVYTTEALTENYSNRNGFTTFHFISTCEYNGLEVTTEKSFRTKKDANEEAARLMLEKLSANGNKKVDKNILCVIDLDSLPKALQFVEAEYLGCRIIACGGPRATEIKSEESEDRVIWQTKSALNDAADVELIWKLAQTKIDDNCVVKIYSTDKIFANCVNILKKSGVNDVQQIYSHK